MGPTEICRESDGTDEVRRGQRHGIPQPPFSELGFNLPSGMKGRLEPVEKAQHSAPF
jgi:hypothetical protein